MAHYNLGLFLRERGQLEEAIACFKKASELLPTDPYPQYYLAWQLTICPEHRLRDPVRALALAKKAVELAPPKGNDWVGNYWMALGAAQYRAGRLDLAVERLTTGTRAVLEEERAIAGLFLVMTHARLGHAAEARQRLGKAAAWIDEALQGKAEERPLRWDQRFILQRLRWEAEAVVAANTH